MFSSRLPEHLQTNALTVALHEASLAGVRVTDLTPSNPTVAGLPYPPDLLAALADRRALTYDPDPRGRLAAREAVAADALRRAAVVQPDHIVLTASTSEAYSWLFKLLCDPGDVVLVPRPSYPLFDHLTRLDGVESAPYDLDYHGRWSIDFTRLDEAPARTRAVLLVSPNNPTGSYVTASDLARLTALSMARGWTIIADEVFADYRLEASDPVTDLATRLDVPTFTLGGASKSLGLPQVKLGWIVAGGPLVQRAEALKRLELIADTYLSVGTPVQMAAPALLAQAAVVREAIHARVRHNLEQARAIVAAHPACALLPAEGGWSIVLRVPAVRTEEQLVLRLIERERILVHPGYFFDFPHEAFIVVSLLPPPAIFADALSRVVADASTTRA
jgi:alanine-synthesizing transaminase